jgi:hypothetical protein
VEKAQLTEFSGIAGHVLHRSVSVASLITGLMLTFVLFVGSWVLVLIQAPYLATPFGMIVVALALSRFAVNGVFGEWGGTVFSCRGGNWFQVFAVAARYLTLTALWFVPMMLFGPREQQIAESMTMGGSGRLIVFLGIYLLALTLTPPLFLIVAVGVERFSDLFQGAHWRRLFRDRLDDLFSIYAIYTGGVGMVLTLSIPLVVLAFMVSRPLGWISAAVAFCLMLGTSANLLGRLCGFFACGNVSAQVAQSETTPMQPLLLAPDDAAGLPQGLPTPQLEGCEPALHHTAVAPALAAVEPSIDPTDSRPPLMDAQPRIEELLNRLPTEPDAVRVALEELHTSFASHPHVMMALTVCRYRAGEADGALELAREALPLCFERGHSHLAAEIFRELRPVMDQLDLNRDQVLTIARCLVDMDDLANAAKAYSAVLNTDAGEIRAIKGLLKVADDILHQKERPQAAARVYRFLLERCGSSPLAEFMQRGLEEAERGGGTT